MQVVTPAAETRVPALSMRGINKSFPGVRALRDVSLDAWAGEVHALMGENGAGKSTLMKILAGAYGADSGEIFINGEAVHITNPRSAQEAGIALIYQELNVAPNLTVAENIFLGNELHGPLGTVRRRPMIEQAQKVLDGLAAPFSAATPCSRLSIAEQQQVEIARALYRNSRILVMDEPTTALSSRETDRLFELVRKLRDDGIAIIYISHRMEEVYEIADRLSVLRDGEYVGTLEREEISARQVVQMMVGRTLAEFFEKESHAQGGAPVLQVRGLTDGHKGRVKPCSFDLHVGEVLGLSGLVGAGRTELARLIFGADTAAGGEILLEGKPVRITRPSDAIGLGIGYLPENRKDQGLFVEMTARENIAISVIGRDSHGGILDRRAERQVAQHSIDQLSIRVASQSAKALGLSGGNQQKLLVGRWLAIHPKVLLLDEPTRGVDVGAKHEIYRIIGDLTAQGVAVLFISSELPEILGMSDRVLVMREGEIVGEVGGDGRPAITQENIMAYATGNAHLVQVKQ